MPKKFSVHDFQVIIVHGSRQKGNGPFFFRSHSCDKEYAFVIYINIMKLFSLFFFPQITSFEKH